MFSITRWLSSWPLWPLLLRWPTGLLSRIRNATLPSFHFLKWESSKEQDVENSASVSTETEVCLLFLYCILITNELAVYRRT
jgi:hypothetical protein